MDADVTERDDTEWMTHTEVAKLWPISEDTLRKWVREGYFPRPTVFGRQQRWRWKTIRLWIEATEYLQSIGVTTLIPPEHLAEFSRMEPHGDAPGGDLDVSGRTDDLGDGVKRKPR